MEMCLSKLKVTLSVQNNTRLMYFQCNWWNNRFIDSPVSKLQIFLDKKYKIIALFPKTNLSATWYQVSFVYIFYPDNYTDFHALT